MKTQLTLNPVPSADATPTLDRIKDILRPYKLRSRDTGAISVVIRVPTYGAPHSLLFVEDDGLSWSNTRAGDGVQYINSKYDFVGPLEPGESVTISG